MDELEREQMRIKMKAEANYQRNLRYKDSRLRTIGIHVGALDQQVLEKKKQREDEIEADRLERQRNAEIDALLEATHQEEKDMRKKMSEDMRRDWEDAKQLKDERKAQEREEFRKPLSDHSLRFGGEDDIAPQRVKEQKQQMKRWTQEAMDDAAYRKMKQRDEELAYAEMVRAIEEIREQNENGEKDMRKELQRSVMEENRELARARAKARMDEKLRSDADTANTLPLTTSASGTIRKDTFKGFSKDKQREILLYNEKLKEIKRQQNEQEKRIEEDWYREQLKQQRLLAQVAMEEAAMRKQLNDSVLSTLEEQKREYADKMANERDERYRLASGDFYKNFGTSCR